MAKRKRKRKGEGPWAQKRLKAIVAAGEPLVEPRCFYTDACGGCTWQQVPYARQLELKHELVADALRQARLVPRSGVIPPVWASPQDYAYRNKMDFSFAKERFFTRKEIESGQDLRRAFALGMFGPATRLKVVDIEDCPIQGDYMNRVLRATRAWALARGLAAFVAERQEGFLRYLMLREAAATGQTLVTLVTSHRDEAVLADYVAYLRAEELLPTCVANGVRGSFLPSSAGMELFTDHGAGHFEEELAGLRFQIAADGFFQVNTPGAEVLVQEVLRQAALQGEERVLDLYCGAGTLSLPLAGRARAVEGYEVIEAAVAGARLNAEQNGISNTSFGVQDLNRGLPRELSGSFDLVVTDPPRAGMHPKVLRGLARLGAPRIVAVGCKPLPLAENLAWLCAEGGYVLEELQPIDLFPHTPHVEVVATLVRVSEPPAA